MNVLIMSPHFPPNFYNFCVALKQAGANVLGMADEAYDNLRPELREALTEYYKVNDLHNYDELIRALGYFTFKHGKIDRIESHNEYWLETDAKLRTDFNIFGIKADEIAFMQYKSRMKAKFIEARIPAARGRIVHLPEDALDFIAEVGYPVVAKPDKGVGALNTYKIYNKEELYRFFREKPPVEYIMEEFVTGGIQTFDGLVNRDGNIVFSTCHVYNKGVMEIVNDDLDLYYYSLRDLPEKLVEYGTRIIDAFDIKERFFHFEFFNTNGSDLIALEVNMRPPGGWTMDMFNYAADINLYQEWANLIFHNKFMAKDYERKYYTCYVGMKSNRLYRHSHDDIMREYGDLVVYHAEMLGIFASVMGSYGYILRDPDLDNTLQAVKFIHQK